MEAQLKKSGIDPEFTKNIDLNWATSDISRLLKQYTNSEYILIISISVQLNTKIKNGLTSKN